MLYKTDDELSNTSSVFSVLEGEADNDTEYLQIQDLQAGKRYWIYMQLTTNDNNMLQTGLVAIYTLREGASIKRLSSKVECTVGYCKTLPGETPSHCFTCIYSLIYPRSISPIKQNIETFTQRH